MIGRFLSLFGDGDGAVCREDRRAADPNVRAREQRHAVRQLPRGMRREVLRAEGVTRTRDIGRSR